MPIYVKQASLSNNETQADFEKFMFFFLFFFKKPARTPAVKNNHLEIGSWEFFKWKTQVRRTLRNYLLYIALAIFCKDGLRILCVLYTNDPKTYVFFSGTREGNSIKEIRDMVGCKTQIWNLWNSQRIIILYYRCSVRVFNDCWTVIVAHHMLYTIIIIVVDTYRRRRLHSDVRFLTGQPARIVRLKNLVVGSPCVTP